jgi:hypothetical protein
MSDAKGVYDVTGPFGAAVTIHVTKDGYRPAVSTVGLLGSPPAHGSVGVLLVPDISTAQIAPGAYTLTITAGAGCDAIPADLRTVVYPAKVSPIDSASSVTLVTVSNTFPGPDDGFGIGQVGQQAAFEIDGPALIREFPGATYLGFGGSGTATIAYSPATNVTFDIQGTLDYCVLTSPMPRDEWISCNILPGNQIVKHTTCQASGFVLSATQQDQGAALTRRRRP